MSRRRRSIRTRLTLAVGLMVGLLASVSAVAAYAWFAASLEQELEDFGIHETEEIAQVVAAVTSIDAGAREALMRLLPEDGVLSLEVWSLEGERVYAHPASIAEAAWPEGLAEARAGRLAVDREWREDGIDGVRVARLIRYGKEPRWIAVAAVSHAQTGALLAQARIFAGLGVCAVTLLSSAGSFWLLGSALRPVRDLVDEAVGLVGRRDGSRLAEPPGSELADLATLLNRMLEQTEESLARLRSFTANAGHELRTPLARMRGEIESSLAVNGPPDREVLVEALDEIDAMRGLLDGLLDLARGEEVQVRTADRFDLADLVAEVAEEAALVGGEGGVRVEMEGAGPAFVVGSRALLARLLWNLVDNALNAVSPGGRVVLRLTRRDPVRGAVEIEDDGPGTGVADPDVLFEAFRRGEDGERRRGGFGLGLALSRAIARRHGGDLEWMPKGELGGARLQLWLPLDGDPRPLEDAT